ncbi:MAG: MarR family transcriptional regulator [Anaerolineae bacterium]|nr:MarR family transcriptional regulator [Anaerolineae bacterium]
MSQTEELYQLLMSTLLLLDDGNNRFFQQYGMTGVRFHTLKHVSQNPGISLSDLSRRLLCTKGNATRIVKSMESDGYLRREENPGDNRAMRLYITPDGETLWREVSQAHLAFNESRFGKLSPPEQSALHQELVTLNDHLNAMLHSLK